MSKVSNSQREAKGCKSGNDVAYLIQKTKEVILKVLNENLNPYFLRRNFSTEVQLLKRFDSIDFDLYRTNLATPRLNN